MKAVLLAGGLGTRLSEETSLIPKPMAEIGGKPILWHIMKSLSGHGINEFIICCGYKGYVIKEYFDNYFRHVTDFTIDLKTGERTVLSRPQEEWRITLIDTGQNTQTGGRIRRIRDHIDGTFLMTYGDGVSDVDIKALIEFHQSSGRKATVTAIQPPGRFGALKIVDDSVESFLEKPDGDGSWINGGFFILEPSAIETIEDDLTIWEREPLESLAKNAELAAYRHTGFWRPMDTLRDKIVLNELWDSGDAPWKTWED